MAQEIRIERPTVLIGLGGTGKQTLLYLRRMFFDRYGVKTLPHVAQLVIDTDARQHNLDGTEYDEFAREVAFDDEIVATPLDQALRIYRENRAQYPHIDSWLDRSLDSHGQIADGAGQIRSFGRLAFFHHYQAIEAALRNAYKTVRDRTAHDAALKDFNLQVDTSFGIDTWLVFSVAGGTGSGMFLDTAFLAKQVGSGFGGGETRSIILLPTAFSSDLPRQASTTDEHRVFANAYAALMELETYNYQRGQDGDSRKPTKFQVQWTAEQFRRQPKLTLDGPVFDTTWLIDNEPRAGGGQVVNEKMALCQMIAEWLFIQYGATVPALAGEIRSNRSNNAKRLVPLAAVKISHVDDAGDRNRQGAVADEDPVTLLYSRRYGSFGLSKIYVPTANLAGQAYARLVGDVANMWLTDERKGDVRKAIDARLHPSIHLPSRGAVQGFTDVLGRRLSVDGMKEQLSRRFERLINDEHQKLKGRLFEEGAEIEARDWFNHEIMTKLLDASSAAAARRGEISRTVQPENATQALVEIQTALDKFVSDALATPGERIGFTDEALRLTVKDFQQAVLQAQQRAQREERRGQGLQRDLEQLLIWAGDHRGFDRAKLFEAAFFKMSERAKAEFRRQVFLAVAKVSSDAAAHIGVGRTVKDEDGKERVIDTGLLSNLASLRDTLAALGRRSRERIYALRQQPVSPLNSRAPAAEHEGDDAAEAELTGLYKDADNQPIGEDQLQRYEQQLYLALGHKRFNSPWFLKDRADASGREQTFLDLLEFARGQLSHLPTRMEDALARFDRKFRQTDVRGQYEAELDRVIGRGTPWLPMPTHNMGGDESFRNLDEVSADYVVFSPRAAEGPKNAMLKAASGRDRVDGPLDTVYFESEVAGVPLFAVRQMDLYRNAYIGHLDADDPATRVVHTELDLEKFVDLLPFNAGEMDRRHAAIKTFVRAVVGGVVTPDPSGAQGQAEWRFYENRQTSARPTLRRLGQYVRAIRSLANPGSSLCGALQGEVDGVYANKLTQDDQGRIFCLIEEMQEQAPIEGAEWLHATTSVLNDLRRKYGEVVVSEAKAARTGMASWAETVPSGGEAPFWRLRTD